MPATSLLYPPFTGRVDGGLVGPRTLYPIELTRAELAKWQKRIHMIKRKQQVIDISGTFEVDTVTCNLTWTTPDAFNTEPWSAQSGITGDLLTDPDFAENERYYTCQNNSWTCPFNSTSPLYQGDGPALVDFLFAETYPAGLTPSWAIEYQVSGGEGALYPSGTGIMYHVGTTYTNSGEAMGALKIMQWGPPVAGPESTGAGGYGPSLFAWAGWDRFLTADFGSDIWAEDVVEGDPDTLKQYRGDGQMILTTGPDYLDAFGYDEEGNAWVEVGKLILFGKEIPLFVKGYFDWYYYPEGGGSVVGGRVPITFAPSAATIIEFDVADEDGYWPWDPGDGLGPVVDSATGDILRQL